MTFDDISNLYAANQALTLSLGALAGVAVLLMAANRLRAMKEHRATLLVANILTIIAAALATMVSASGMWKFFTDILGETPLRIAFFAFIEIALFASALLARSRLLREPQKRTTGVDGIAVWVLAALTATLSALHSDSFREVCLRLAAPLVAAWMWERALAAERNVRLGNTARQINWTLTPQRILVWLRLAEANDRDVTEVDRARRRAKLGRARLHLHLLQNRNAYAWRVRRAHRKVLRQAMRAAEHIGLADFPGATNEREAVQMYMATLYGFVDATSPQAVAHLNAWRSTPQLADTTTGPAADGYVPGAAPGGFAERTPSGVNGTKPAIPLPHGHTAHDQTSHTATPPGRAEEHDSPPTMPAATVPRYIARQPSDGHQRFDLNDVDPRLGLENLGAQTATPPTGQHGGTDELDSDDDLTGGDLPDGEADLTAVAAMRRFWDREVAHGRVPTGAELSRAAGVPPTTGLGRRKRREWEADLPEPLKAAADAAK